MGGTGGERVKSLMSSSDLEPDKEIYICVSSAIIWLRGAVCMVKE